MSAISLAVCGATGAGKVRTNNEDAFAVSDLTRGERALVSLIRTRVNVGDRGVLLVVSDGMGGEKAGEVASALAITALCEHLAGTAETEDAAARLCAAVEHANARVVAAASDAERKGMGATVTALFISGDHAVTAEVGDSRAYVLREGVLTQITKDQTYMQLLVERGLIAPQAVGSSQAKNVILQAIGKAPQVVVAQRRLALRRGDRLLLCSDGLFNEVPDADLCEVLTSTWLLGEACGRLMEMANDAGGRDNITLLLAECDGEGLPAARDGEPFADTLTTLREFSVGESPGDPTGDPDV